jgi:hypothetical protein
MDFRRFIMSGAVAWLLLAAGCKQSPRQTANERVRKDSILKQKDTALAEEPADAMLLDTTISKDETLKISRIQQGTSECLVFSENKMKLQIPWIFNMRPNSYYSITDIYDPKLSDNCIFRFDGLLLASFDHIFRIGDLAIIRETVGNLSLCTGENGLYPRIISSNGCFLVDSKRRIVISFGYPDLEPSHGSRVSLEVYKIRRKTFGQIGHFVVSGDQFYDVNKTLLIKAYLNWIRKRERAKLYS